MFYYKEEKKKYYIWSDKSIWQYWPFEWIYVKNKEFGIVEKNIDYQEYLWYKYSIWFWENKIFILSENWLEDIIEK